MNNIAVGGAGITPQFVLKPTVWVTGSFVGRGFDITVVSQRDTWQSWKTTAIIVAMTLRYVLPELFRLFNPFVACSFRFLALFFCMEFVVAQDNVGDESTISYPASYFSQWSPVTAQDMLIRIPGFDAQSIGGSSRSSRWRSS